MNKPYFCRDFFLIDYVINVSKIQQIYCYFMKNTSMDFRKVIGMSYICSKAHCGPCQTSIMKLFTKIHQGFRSTRQELFLGKSVLKRCNKFTGEHPCRSVISIKIALRHGCSPVTLMHFFRTIFSKKTSGWLLLRFLAVNYIFIKT